MQTIFVVDTSGSVACHLKTIFESIKSIVERKQSTDAVGLITFNSMPTIQVLPIRRKSVFQHFLKSASKLQGGGGTDIIAALEMAVKCFDNTDRQIVLITDGIDDIQSLQKVSKEIEELGIRIVICDPGLADALSNLDELFVTPKG